MLYELSTQPTCVMSDEQSVYVLGADQLCHSTADRQIVECPSYIYIYLDDYKLCKRDDIIDVMCEIGRAHV